MRAKMRQLQTEPMINVTDMPEPIISYRVDKDLLTKKLSQISELFILIIVTYCNK